MILGTPATRKPALSFLPGRAALPSGLVSLLALGLLAACTGGPAPQDAPIVTSATYQHALYTGFPLPLDARTETGDAPLIVTYYKSAADRDRKAEGSAEAPAEVGSYYARIERPVNQKYAEGPPVDVEYSIQKAFVTIDATERQSAVYDGKPKDITASADFGVALEVRYFLSEHDRNGGMNALPASPVEAGVYYAIARFPGNDSLRPASKDVEFTILK